MDFTKIQGIIDTVSLAIKTFVKWMRGFIDGFHKDVTFPTIDEIDSQVAEG